MMLILVLMLALLAGHLTVAALRASAQPWRGIDLFWSLLVGLALTSWLGQALADVGWFRHWLIVGALGGYSVLLALRLRERALPRGLRPPPLELATLGVVLLVGAALFFQPAETPIGGRDDGLRLMAGATVAQHGGWLLPSSLLPDLPLYRGPQNDLKHIGFLVWDAGRGLLVPQFTGAHEVWQAIAYGWPATPVAGDVRATHPAMFYLNPLLALGALLAVYTLGRLLFGARAALIGALLLAVNVAQVWYARQTMAEILLQTLLLGGIAAACAYLQQPRRETALAAGLAFGVALLTKVDALIGLAALGGVALLVWPQRRRWPFAGWLLLPLALAVAHYAAHSVWFSAAYFSNNLGSLVVDPRLIAAAAVLLGGAALALIFRPRWQHRLDALLARPLPGRWRVAALAALLLLVGYGYFVRPSVLAQEWFIHSVWQERFPTYRGLNLVLLVAYLTPLGFGLGLAGAARWVTRELRAAQLPFLALVLGYGLLFTYNAMVVGDQPFWVRRFLPVVIPGVLLLAGSALAALWQSAPRWRWSSPALLTGLLAWTMSQTMPVAAIRSGAGLGEQLAAVAAEIPADAVVLFQDWQAGFALAAPLETLYGRESYALTGAALSGDAAQRWRDQLASWQRAGRPLIYVATDGRLTLPAAGLALEPLATHTIAYRTLETTHERLPRQPVDAAQRVDLLRIVDAPVLPVACSAAVEVGGADYGAIGPGFYPSEESGPAATRWSHGRASLVLPALTGGDDAIVTLRLNDIRPPEAGAATLAVSLAGQPLATLPLTTGWRDYEVRVPAALLAQPAPLLLDLETTPWKPQDFGQPDGRELGVLVDSFTARRVSCVNSGG